MAFSEGGKVLLSSPDLEEDVEASYVQDGQRLNISVPVWKNTQFEVLYDGEKVEYFEDQRPGEISYIVATDF